jgi:hypothetical protein
VAALLAFVVPLACVNWIKDCAEQIVRCARELFSSDLQ